MIESITIARLPQWIDEICAQNAPSILPPSTEGSESSRFLMKT